MSFRLVQKSVTLNDIERHMALFCVISANSGSFRAHCVKVHVRYLICWWVLVTLPVQHCFRYSAKYCYSTFSIVLNGNSIVNQANFSFSYSWMTGVVVRHVNNKAPCWHHVSHLSTKDCKTACICPKPDFGFRQYRKRFLVSGSGFGIRSGVRLGMY